MRRHAMTPFLKKVSYNGDSYSNFYLFFLKKGSKHLQKTRVPYNEIFFHPSQTKVIAMTHTHTHTFALLPSTTFVCVWAGGGEGTGAVTRAAALC